MILFASRAYNKRRTQRGFTMVEIIVASAIGVLVTAGAMYLLLAWARTSKAVLLQSQLDQQGRVLIRQLQLDVRRSTTIVVRDNSNTSVTNQPGVELELTFPDASVSIYSIASNTITYDEDGPGGQAAIVMIRGTDEGSSFTFVEQPNTRNQVQVSIALTDPFSRDGVQVFKIITTITSRLLPPVV